MRRSATTDQPFRVFAVPTSRNGQRRVLVVAESLTGANEAVQRILVLLLVIGPLAIAVVGLGGLVLVRNALAPVDRMRRKAQRIGIDQLHERLTASNPRDEVGHLAATLNGMLDRLEAGMEARKRLIADASHELRTPLAAMRAELDVSLRDSSADRDRARGARERPRGRRPDEPHRREPPHPRQRRRRPAGAREGSCRSRGAGHLGGRTAAPARRRQGRRARRRARRTEHGEWGRVSGCTRRSRI